MEQTCVDADGGDVDLAVTKHGPRRDSTSLGSRSRLDLGCGLELLGQDANALARLANDVRRDFVGGLRRIEACREGLDDHRQAEARHDCPGVVALGEGGRLVERRASPKVDQEQDLFLVLESGDCLLEVGPEVIRAHGGLEAHDGNVLLVTKDHGARLPHACRKLAMTC